MPTTDNKIPPPPSGTHLALSSSSKILAPASFVFDLLTTPSTWASWNTFVPHLEVVQPDENGDSSNSDTLKLGTKMTAQVRMDPQFPLTLRPQKMTVTGFEKPEQGDVAGAIFSVSWQAEGYPRFLLQADRTSECVAVQGDDGKLACEFRTWEFISRPLSLAVKIRHQSTLQARFEDTARDLKEYAENQYAHRGLV